jgi:peptidyl-prolyl cis-trans isomerase B (cyclophilin B)
VTRAARAALLAAAALALAGCGTLEGFRGGEETLSTVPVPPEATDVAPVLEPGRDGCNHQRPPAADEPRATFDEPPPSPLTGPGPWTVTMTTSCGSIRIELDPALGGDAAAAFAALARAGYYDGLTMHRVVPSFVIQGGDPDGTGAGGPGFTVESPPPGNYTYRNGDVAMAKAGNEPPGTAGSQFFIVSTESGAAQLEPLYAVVGHVVDDESAATLRRIDALGIDDGPPVEPVWIWTARLAEGG